MDEPPLSSPPTIVPYADPLTPSARRPRPFFASLIAILAILASIGSLASWYQTIAYAHAVIGDRAGRDLFADGSTILLLDLTGSVLAYTAYRWTPAIPHLMRGR